jgi:hypothetical protein
MATIEPLQDEDLPFEEDRKGDIGPLRAQLEARCAAAKIPIAEVEMADAGEKAVRLGLPCGRDKRSLLLWNYASYERLLSIQFEQYVFLQSLDAICNYQTGTIEASIRASAFSPSRMAFTRLFKQVGQDQLDQGEAGRLHLESPELQVSVNIGEPSNELSVLVRGPGPRMSLTIKAPGLNQHDKALDLLRRASDALFFQIDLIHEVPISLVRERRAPSRRRRTARTEPPAEVMFPTHEYDAAPISLYWYARSAVGMPLLQYLAFYQVIEYYFPTYSQADARRKIKAVLKDPAFRGDRDADLGRLLSAIHISRSGAFGDERSQLRATLLECVDPEAVRQFITADPARADALSAKSKGLSDQKIPIANPTADLRSDVGERIYEIRCKIVHTKTDAKNSEFELLLPFSKEAEQLTHDIDLVQFIAQQVLVAASTPFRA